MSLEEQLAKVPFFASLPGESLSPLAKRARQRVFAPKTTIVYRGDPGGSLFVILSGCVKVHGVMASGEEVLFALLKEGEFFGEMSMIDEAPYSADVTAWEKTECLVLDSPALWDAIEASPLLAKPLLRTLTQRLRDQNGVIESLATLDVKGRVMALLLRLATHHGVPHQAPGVAPTSPSGGEPDVPLVPTRIDLNITHADIAAFVGATRERVSQTISSLRASGYIKTDTDTGRLVVNRPQQLARLLAQR